MVGKPVIAVGDRAPVGSAWVCRKRDRAQHEVGGPVPGAENDRKS